MNTLTKILVLAFGIGFATCAMAQDEGISIIEKPDFYAKMVPLQNSTEMNIYVANWNKNIISLKLKNVDGAELYSKLITSNQPQIYLKLILDHLPNGIYTIEISDKNASGSKSFRKGLEVIVARPIETLIAIN